jgi:hypothetical protein
MTRADLQPGEPAGNFHSKMKFPMKGVAALLLVALGVFLSGCSMNSPEASSIPWNQPADWEGQIPGMGSGGSQVH